MYPGRPRPGHAHTHNNKPSVDVDRNGTVRDKEGAATTCLSGINLSCPPPSPSSTTHNTTQRSTAQHKTAQRGTVHALPCKTLAKYSLRTSLATQPLSPLSCLLLLLLLVCLSAGSRRVVAVLGPNAPDGTVIHVSAESRLTPDGDCHHLPSKYSTYLHIPSPYSFSLSSLSPHLTEN